MAITQTNARLALPGAKPPRYELADSLRTRMHHGELKIGHRLPSLNTLAKTYGVAVNTVRAALDILRSEGMTTESWPGYGTVITALPRPAERGPDLCRDY